LNKKATDMRRGLWGAMKRAGLTKRITPHMLRHYAEFRIMPS
jgi:site-specific recombinase XerD